MKLSKRRRGTRHEMDMTPMIDIVFLLIIFFMTVTQVSKVNKERLDLPEQEGVADQSPKVLTINVMESGDIRISGKTFSIDDLVGVINQELRRVGDNPKQLTVLIRADLRGQSGPVNEILPVLKRLGVEKVDFAVQVPR